MTNYPVSAVPSVRAYLLSTFNTAITAANFTAPTVEVYLGQPDHGTTEDLVVIGDVHRQTPTVRLVGTGGQFWQDEIFTVQVEVACFVPGNATDVYSAVDSRMWSIVSVLETAVRQDPSLGQRVRQASPESTQTTYEWSDTEIAGAHGNTVLAITCNATY